MGCTDCNTKCDSNCNCVVRYTGPDIDCLGVSNGDSFETVLAAVSSFVCDINFEDGADGVGIESIAYDPETDTLTITYTNETTQEITGLAGEDANSDYGNTLFVDQVHGNNTTGTRERFDLPYLTIGAAMTDAQAGDTVWVRNGEYTESITLLDDIDLFFGDVLLNGKLTDNGSPVTCNVSGRLSINYTSNNTVDITGPGSYVTIDMANMDSEGTTFLVESNTEAKTTLNITLDRIFGLSFNYLVSARGNSDLNINVRYSTETAVNTSDSIGFTALDLRDSFAGNLVFKSPTVFIGNATVDNGGILYNETSTTSSQASVKIEIGDFETTYDNGTVSELATINKNGAAKTFINIKRGKCINRDGIHVTGDNKGYLYFSGRFVSENKYALRYSSNQKVVIKDSSLKRGSSGPDDNQTVVIGAPGSIPALTNGIETEYSLEIVDTEIIKESAGTDTTGAIIFKTGEPSVNLKDVEIYGYGTFTGDAVSTDGSPNEDFYFKDVIGNVDVDGPNVNDTSSASGFTFDSNLVVYDFID